MPISKNGIALLQAAIVAGGVATGLWLVASTPTRALVDGSQVLSGGNITNNTGQPLWTSPGNSQAFLTGQFGGKGANAAQLRMPAGVLTDLKVRVTTITAATGGTFVLTVLRNNVDTSLTCSTTGAGNCQNNGSVTFTDNDRLSIRVVDALTGVTNSAFTYSLVFN
jgi:hypothetical protein